MTIYDSEEGRIKKLIRAFEAACLHKDVEAMSKFLALLEAVVYWHRETKLELKKYQLWAEYAHKQLTEMENDIELEKITCCKR